MPSSIISPFPVFNDLDGTPLENGYIYIGQSNLNPETAPVNVFWDAARTIPAAQPIRTIGGFPSRNGSPSNVYVEADTYSITVRNSRRVFVYSAFDQTDAPSSVFDISTQVITATAGQTTFTLTTFTYLPGTDTLQVYRNGLRLTSGTDYLESSTSTVTLTSPAAAGDEFLFQGGSVITGNSTPGTSVSFIQAGTGAVTRNMQDKARESVSVLDFGADPTGVADSTAAFSAAASSAAVVQVEIPAGTYKLLTSPTVSGAVTWVVHRGASFTGAGTLWSAVNRIVSSGDFRSIESDSSFYSGVFGYLEQNAAQSGYGTIGLNGVARTAGGDGSATEADIGIAGFAANDRVGGLGGAWALYGTAIRQPSVNGPTHGLELDIANMGTTVPLFPAAMVAAGQTHALWVATGGEATNHASVGTASVAIGIIRNDSNASPTASFDKGIVFHNVSISGCDGATGNGIAIAMASGHQLVWYNNSNQPVAEIVANNKLVANQQRIDFNNSGILFQDRNNGRINLQVENNSSSVNYFSIRSGSSTDGPHLKAIGDDPAIDIWLEPKGGGVLGVTYGTTPATTPGNFSATRRLAFKDGNNITWYIPVSTTAW